MNNPAGGIKNIVVLGAGPGGYAAAFHAADHGYNVTLVNAEARGGGVSSSTAASPPRHSSTSPSSSTKATSPAVGRHFPAPANRYQ